MGRFIVLPGVNPPTTRPKIDVIDPILPTQGALFLVEPAHPTKPFTDPFAVNAVLPNIAEAQAAVLLGTSDLTKTAMRLLYAEPGFQSGRGKLERTSKGGIHVAISPTLATSDTGLAIEVPTSTFDPALLMRDFLRTTGHSLYLSVWTRTTKVAVAVPNNQADVAEFGNSSAISGNRRAILSAAGQYPAGGRFPAVQSGSGGPALGPHLYTVAGSAWGGTPPSTAGTMVARAFASGGRSAFAYTDELRRARESLVFYRAYCEDLTVSGRTYAEVDALDLKLFNAAFASGGRYFGDTYTDPATIA